MLYKHGVSRVIEDYLVTIIRLEEEYGVAKTGDIALSLNVSPGTVTNTLARLKKMGLIERTPYKGVRLTERGRQLALDILKRHRLVERLLTDVLGVEWYKVHEIAHKLEHGVDGIERYLENVLGPVSTCPHGNPILMEKKRQHEVPMAQIRKRGAYVVVRIVMEDEDTLKYLEERGIKPGTIFIFEERDVDKVKIKIGEEVIILDGKFPRAIIVREAK